eukprot:8450545-Alexandrium_andersonii.AAC.1
MAADREDLSTEGQDRFKRLRSHLTDKEDEEVLVPFLKEYSGTVSKNLFAEFDKRQGAMFTRVDEVMNQNEKLGVRIDESEARTNKRLDELSE